MADLFTEFVQKSGELYGTTAMDWAPYYRVGVVRFERNEKGQIAGKYRGTVVYRNKNYTNSIHEGETYIVSLESNPLTGRNYFAKPIAKLDAKFFFELTKDQIDLLAERLWESNRMAILPFLEGKYKEEFDGLLQKQREELTSEYGAKIDELTTSVADLEQSAKQDKRIIEDLQASAGVASPKKKAATSSTRTGETSGTATAEKEEDLSDRTHYNHVGQVHRRTVLREPELRPHATEHHREHPW